MSTSADEAKLAPATTTEQTQTTEPTPKVEPSEKSRNFPEEGKIREILPTLDTEIPPGLIVSGSKLFDSDCLIWRFPGGESVKSFTREPSNVLRATGLVESTVNSKWTTPNRAEMFDYKTQSQRLSPVTGEVYLDLLTMQEILIRHHLMGLFWIGIEKIARPLVELRQRNGKLDKASLEALSKLHPTLIDLLYSGFLQEANLIF